MMPLSPQSADRLRVQPDSNNSPQPLLGSSTAREKAWEKAILSEGCKNFRCGAQNCVIAFVVGIKPNKQDFFGLIEKE